MKSIGSKTKRIIVLAGSLQSEIISHFRCLMSLMEGTSLLLRVVGRLAMGYKLQ